MLTAKQMKLFLCLDELKVLYKFEYHVKLALYISCLGNNSFGYSLKQEQKLSISIDNSNN